MGARGRAPKKEPGYEVVEEISLTWHLVRAEAPARIRVDKVLAYKALPDGTMEVHLDGAPSVLYLTGVTLDDMDRVLASADVRKDPA